MSVKELTDQLQLNPFHTRELLGGRDRVGA